MTPTCIIALGIAAAIAGALGYQLGRRQARRVVLSLAKRVADQAELLRRRAEK
jgi:hypothetical protein